MQNHPDQDLAVLIDRLTRQTEIYYKLLAEGCNEEEYLSCKETIRQLQAAIESRKKVSRSSQTSGDKMASSSE